MLISKSPFNNLLSPLLRLQYLLYPLALLPHIYSQNSFLFIKLVESDTHVREGHLGLLDLFVSCFSCGFRDEFVFAQTPKSLGQGRIYRILTYRSWCSAVAEDVLVDILSYLIEFFNYLFVLILDAVYCLLVFGVASQFR